MRYADDEAFIDFCYVPVGRNRIFDLCDVEIVVFNPALTNQIVCYSGYVIAVIDVSQLVYLGQTLFSKGVYYDSISVFCFSGDIFYQGTEVEQIVVSF